LADVPLPIVSEPGSAPPGCYNILILGNDPRKYERGAKNSSKTDIILLASVLDKDPIKVSVIQFPHDFYTEVEALDDMWLSHVWAKESYPGLHYYFQEAFGIPLHAVFCIEWEGYEGLIKTDLSTPEQIHFLFSMGLKLMDSDCVLSRYRLATSGQIVYGDTLLEAEGWTTGKGRDLMMWIREILC